MPAAAGQDPNNARLYRLGVRLREVELLIGHATNLDELGVACRYLRFADDDLVKIVVPNPVCWRVADARDLLRKIHSQLQRVRETTREKQTDGLVREVAEISSMISSSLNGTAKDWFELGREVVPLPNYPHYARTAPNGLPAAAHAAETSPPPAPRDTMRWAAKSRLDALLRRTKASLQDLLAEPDSDDQAWFNGVGQFADELWPLYWVERGLERLEEVLPAVTAGQETPEAEVLKPASDKTLRNLYFLKWYEDKGAETYESPAKIRDRWNATHDNKRIARGKGGGNLVQKGMKAARGFLEKHGVSIDAAIEQLERQESGRP